MKLILLCFVLTLTSLSVHALSCLPCDKVTCAKPSGCPGGLTDDVCGCCKVCARVYNETCGGPWNSTGTCDSGLFCSKDPGLDEIASFTADGRCECKSPRVLSSCGSCLATCVNPSPHCEGDCEEGCVCPEGTIQKNSTNTTCVKMSECSECEYPKVFSACNGHCPRTCNNRFPICIAVCRAGCVCPEEMVQKSLDDTTCIWESECPTETCEITECPAVASTTCSRDALISWVCEVENFRCSTFKWKQEMEAWMLESNCSYLRENPWDHVFQCGTGEMECTNRSARTVVYDAFNCPFVKCTDGQYKNPKALFTIWRQFAANHRQTMMSYQKAAASCNSCD